MAGAKAAEGTGAGGPAGAAFGAVEAGVEAEAGDFDEGVALGGVDGDVAAFTGGAVFAECGGRNGALEEAGAAEDVRDGARAVVAIVHETAVTAAVFVGEGDELVAGVDGGEDAWRESAGGDGVAAMEDGGFSRLVLVLPGFGAERATCEETAGGKEEQARNEGHE
jgi:hypothetical protein